MIGNMIQRHLVLGFGLRRLLETSDRYSTQLAKMSIDPRFVELTGDVVRKFYKIPWLAFEKISTKLG